jgi:hypothetical protein
VRIRLRTTFALAMAIFTCCFLGVHAQGPADRTPNEADRPILLTDALPSMDATPRLVSMGAALWLQVNQDPASYGSGVIDVMAMLDTLARQSLPKWVILDFEEPFFANLKKAGSEERRRSVASMLLALREAKRVYPGVKWGFYGLPNLEFWIGGKGWAELDAGSRADALAKAEAACREVVAEADWLSISVYDYYDPALVKPGSPTSLRGTPELAVRNGIAWRTEAVQLARRLANGRPVIPMVSPFWAPGGIAPSCHLIPLADFMARQVKPCTDAGVSGIALYTGYTYRLSRVTSSDPDPPRTEASYGQAEWRKAFVTDLLGGVTPPDWSAPALRRQLERDLTTVVLDRLRAIDTAMLGSRSVPEPTR